MYPERMGKANCKTIMMIVAVATVLLATIALTMTNIDNTFAYSKNQASAGTNTCGNGQEPTNVGCQNTDLQIQGDENSVALTAQQTFPVVVREELTTAPPPLPTTEPPRDEPPNGTLSVQKICMFIDGSDCDSTLEFNIEVQADTDPSPSPDTFSLHPGDSQDVEMGAGNYTITESYSVPFPYEVIDVEFDGDCEWSGVPTATGTMAAGGFQQCTITNTLDSTTPPPTPPPALTSLIVSKRCMVLNQPGQICDPYEALITVTGNNPQPSTFVLTQDKPIQLVRLGEGAYTVTEQPNFNEARSPIIDFSSDLGCEQVGDSSTASGSMFRDADSTCDILNFQSGSPP